MSFSSLFHCVTDVLIQVYNWEIRHHSLVCCCGLPDILYIIFVLFSFIRVADILIVFFVVVVVVFSRTVLLTSWNRTQRSKSHSRETWWFMVILGVIGGISSSMETNAVDQWRLKLSFSTTGHLGTLICIIIGHLRGTVKTSHKGRLEWNYG